MPLRPVAHIANLPPDTVIEVLIEGEPYALCNIAGTIHALGGTCPHSGGPLGQGAVNGNAVTCPWHGWDFDCQTGENNFDPGRRVEVFPIHIEDGSISIELP